MSKIYKFPSVNDLLTFLKNESEKNLLAEVCGLISYEEKYFSYAPMENISLENNFFKISPKDYFDFIKKYNCFCIFHSHICGNENPSEIDILNSKNSCKAYLIYSIITEKFSIFEPLVKDYDVNIIESIIKKI